MTCSEILGPTPAPRGRSGDYTEEIWEQELGNKDGFLRHRGHRRGIRHRWFVLLGPAPDAPGSGTAAGLLFFLRVLVDHCCIGSFLLLVVWGLGGGGGRLVHVFWFIDPGGWSASSQAKFDLSQLTSYCRPSTCRSQLPFCTMMQLSSDLS